MKIIHTIYKFVNLYNNRIYIGYTSNWQNRLKNHQSRYQTINTAFYHAIRKYGWDMFSHEIIYQSLDKEHTLNEMEGYFIREYNSHIDDGHGYNMSYGGEGNKNYCIETRYKLGSANRGKTLKPRSEETKRKIGIANSKKKRTDAEKQHLRDINLGKKQSEECVLKRSKQYVVTNPNGESIVVHNLNKFCKENDLNQGAMSAIARGVLSKHKGWSCSFYSP